MYDFTVLNFTIRSIIHLKMNFILSFDITCELRFIFIEYLIDPTSFIQKTYFS